MNILVQLLVILFVFISSANQAQELVLHKKSNLKRQVIIDLESDLVIISGDAVFRSNVVSFTDSSLFIKVSEPTGIDTFRIVWRNEHRKDTVYYSKMEYVNKELLFANIDMIKIPRFKNQKWLELPSWLLFGAAFNLLGLPFAAIINQGDSFDEWAKVEVSLIVLSVPPILIGISLIKYDTKEKWNIVNQKKIVKN